MILKVFSVGLLIGILDGFAAIIMAWLRSGIKPDRVFQYIASGLFGKEAFYSGVPMIIIGIFFHFLIAIVATAVFFLVYTRIFQIKKLYWLHGAVYGIIVWIIMNYMVIPLSAIGKVTPTVSQAITGLLIHIFIIGIPISFFAGRNYISKNSWGK